MCKANAPLLTGILILGFGWQPAAAAEFLLGAPTRFGPEVNSSKSDITPSLSSDGLTMYFSSNRPGGIGNQSLWQVKRESVNAPWESPVNLSGIGGVYSESPSISPDGLELYFADGWAATAGSGGNPRPGGQGRADIWVSKRNTLGDLWGEPENLGPTINSSSADDTPFISADGLSLYFGSNRRGGSGGNDLYVSKRQSLGDAWGEPQNVGPGVNTRSYEWMGGVSADGLALIFESDRPGSIGLSGDAFVATRTSVEEDFGAPVKISQTVNVSADAWGLTMSADGTALYYNVGHGDSVDLWEVPLLPFESVHLKGGGDTYVENFDEALGGNTRPHEAILPTGWAGSDNGVVFDSTTTGRFPASTRFANTLIYNAGGVDDMDRALAIGVSSASPTSMLELLVDVTETDATGLELSFDVEAWDAARSAVSPGEAAFNVTVDVDSGNGFISLANLGTVSTGIGLQPPTDRLLDGNDGANRVSYDSGRVDAVIPEGSTLRIRWAAATDGSTEGWVFGLDNVAFSLLGGDTIAELLAGDADQDFDFDQLDLIRVQQAARYLTGEPATWGEGDWNGAPGGSQGNPPVGDGVFNQLDIIASQQAAAYLSGSYAVVRPDGTIGDGHTSLIYNVSTGEVAIDAPAGVELTSINIDSTAGIFTGDASQNLSGSFDNDADGNVFKATFGGSFGSISFGNVAQSGLSEQFVLGDLSVVGSLAGGGELGEVDLIYVPEPSAIMLLMVGTAIGLLRFRSRHCKSRTFCFINPPQ